MTKRVTRLHDSHLSGDGMRTVISGGDVSTDSFALLLPSVPFSGEKDEYDCNRTLPDAPDDANAMSNDTSPNHVGAPVILIGAACERAHGGSTRVNALGSVKF